MAYLMVLNVFFKTTMESHLTFEIWIEFSNLKIGKHTYTIYISPLNIIGILSSIKSIKSEN
jgi:hypothetical protein